MKKILLPLNSRQMNAASIDFACFLAGLTQSKLTALVLKSGDTELVSSTTANKFLYKPASEASTYENNEVAMDADQGVHFFLEVCKKRMVSGDVIIRGTTGAEKVSVVEETIRESRFADMLVLNPHVSFSHKVESLPTHFVKEVVARSECPVVIAPVEASTVEEVVFCYDGSRSSVFAMKQFAYLFPELKNKKTTLLEIDSKEERIEEKKRIGGWLRAHYSEVQFKTLQGETGDELFQYFLLKKNVFVVIGAYGRSLLSNLFRHSSADLLMRAVDTPLFISHHN